MATRLLSIAVLVLGLGNSEAPPRSLPATAVVVADALSGFVEPDASAMAVDTLRKGDRIQVLAIDPRPGWLTIAPPASAFAWIEQSALESPENGRARVRSARAQTRAGVANARLPGPPGAVLERGETVTLRDRRPLITRTAGRAVTWIAIEPSQNEVRYVRVEGIAWARFAETLPGAQAAGDASRAAYEQSEPAASLPAELAHAIEAIATQHQAIVREPVESWRLDDIKARYEALLKQTTDPAARGVIQDRLAVVEGHDTIARSARSLQKMINESRHRDLLVTEIKEALNTSDRVRRRPFVASGLLQPSSRLVDGHRVYALIGPEGRSIAYLDVPPGLDARPVLAKRVGVRGSVRYNESLGSRLIAVKDLEPLE